MRLANWRRYAPPKSELYASLISRRESFNYDAPSGEHWGSGFDRPKANALSRVDMIDPLSSMCCEGGFDFFTLCCTFTSATGGNSLVKTSWSSIMASLATQPDASACAGLWDMIKATARPAMKRILKAATTSFHPGWGNHRLSNTRSGTKNDLYRPSAAGWRHLGASPPFEACATTLACLETLRLEQPRSLHLVQRCIPNSSPMVASWLSAHPRAVLRLPMKYIAQVARCRPCCSSYRSLQLPRGFCFLASSPPICADRHIRNRSGSYVAPLGRPWRASPSPDPAVRQG
jgi:hypothetical protein